MMIYQDLIRHLKKLSGKINVYVDRNIKDKNFIRNIESTFSILNSDCDFNKTQCFLEFFYTKSSEFNFNLSNDLAKEKLFHSIKEYDLMGVNRLIILISIYSIFSAGHNAFFYKFMFPKSKRNSIPKEKAINSFGDIRYLMLMPYLIKCLNLVNKDKKLNFRFLTGDSNLAKVINALKLNFRISKENFEYKIESFNIKDNLDSKFTDKSYDRYHSEITSFLSKLGILYNEIYHHHQHPLC